MIPCLILSLAVSVVCATALCSEEHFASLCSDFGNEVRSNSELSIDCTGSNYTVRYNTVDPPELLNIALSCQTDSCGNFVSLEVPLSTDPDPIVGTVNTMDMLNCTVIGCYQDYESGNIYIFNQHSCILNFDTEVTTIEVVTSEVTTMEEEITTTEEEITTTEEEITTMEVINIEATPDRDQYIIIIIIAVIALMVLLIVVIAVVILVLCGIRRCKIERLHYPGRLSANVMEIDSRYEPVNIKISVTLSDSLPSIYHALWKVKISETQLEEGKLPDYKHVAHHVSTSISKSPSFNYDSDNSFSLGIDDTCSTEGYSPGVVLTSTPPAVKGRLSTNSLTRQSSMDLDQYVSSGTESGKYIHLASDNGSHYDQPAVCDVNSNLSLDRGYVPHGTHNQSLTFMEQLSSQSSINLPSLQSDNDDMENSNGLKFELRMEDTDVPLSRSCQNYGNAAGYLSNEVYHYNDSNN